MAKRSTLYLVIGVVVFIWAAKFGVDFPQLESDLVARVLVTSVVLFGFLAGYFLSEMYADRHIIRHLHGHGELERRRLYERERLLVLEWFALWALSMVITFAVLFLPITGFFTRLISILIPVGVAIAMKLIYDLELIREREEQLEEHLKNVS